MKKMKLEIDALSVQSFSTTGRDGGKRGTVDAHSGTGAGSNGTLCQDITCAYGCFETVDERCEEPTRAPTKLCCHVTE